MTENQLGETQMMEEKAEHVGMNYPKLLTLDMWLDDFLESTIRQFPLSLGREICEQPNYRSRGWGVLWTKNFSQRTTKTATTDGG